MAYVINRYNTAQLTVVEDGTIDQTTDIKLVGKNYAGYGEIQNENFVFLLENFAGANEPPKAIDGQIWYDSGNSKLKFYDGSKWRTTGGAEVSETMPVGLAEGDFWWDTTNEQLYAYNGSSFVLVGPQGVGDSVTRFQSRTIRDSSNVAHPVILSIVDDEIVHIISNFEFIIHPDELESYPEFTVVRKGLTLKSANNNGITPLYRWWGTATDSDRLGGELAANYLRSDNPIFSAVARFPDNGLTIGTDNDLIIRIINDKQGYIGNEIGQEIFFQVKDEFGALKMPVRFRGNAILPGYDLAIASGSSTADFTSAGTQIVDLGSLSNKFSTIYATAFNGTATSSLTLKVNGSDLVGSTLSTANTVAVRDASGDLTAKVFVGTATKAYYADLAEKYLADKEYEPGTVLIFGGDAEVTESKIYYDSKLAGVVSTNPAYLMNEKLDGVEIALKGRIPCKVVGSVRKGDLLVSSDIPGVATVYNEENYGIPNALCVIGKSLENNNNTEIKLVEIAV